MNKEQFEDIGKKLAKWREERGLSVEEQRANFKVNYTKELLEFFEAQRDNNRYEMIDSICDMAITAINAGFDFYVLDCIDDYTLPTFNIINPLFDDNTLSLLLIELEKVGYNPYKCLLETIKELETRTGKWCEKEGKWIKDLGAYTEEEAIKKVSAKVWNEYHSLDSVEKQKEDDEYWYFDCEIDDGYYIEEKAKKWYRADYEKCKIVEN